MIYASYSHITKTPVVTYISSSDSDSVVVRQWVKDAASNIGIDSPDQVLNMIITVLVIILFGIVVMLIKDNR